MAAINTQAIIDAVTLKLREAYPASIILDDEASQGIAPGAFIVRLISESQQPHIAGGLRRNPLLEVLYFSAGSTRECVRVADELALLLREVRTLDGDRVAGTGISWLTDEEYVLHATVSYGHNLLVPDDSEYMETLTIEGEIYG